MTSGSTIHTDLHKPNNKLVSAYSWSIFSTWMNHMHTQTHKIHHGLDLGEATTFPLIIFSTISHGSCTQMLFFSELPTLEAKNFSCILQIEMRSKTKLYPWLKNFQQICGTPLACK